MTQIYTKAEEHTLVKDTLLTTLDTMGKEWRVTHDFKPTKYLSVWANSLQLTIGGDMENYGDRTPIIFPSNQNSPGKMKIASAVNGAPDYGTTPDQPSLNVWTTIAISQTLEEGKYMFRISIGDQEVHAVENTQPEVFRNVKVYGSNSNHAAQPGSIRNLVIETKVEVPVDGGWGPWSCATGTIERTCSDPPPANGGEPCEELVEGTDLTGGCQY